MLSSVTGQSTVGGAWKGLEGVSLEPGRPVWGGAEVLMNGSPALLSSADCGDAQVGGRGNWRGSLTDCAGVTHDIQAFLPGRSGCHCTMEDVPLFESTVKSVRFKSTRQAAGCGNATSYMQHDRNRSGGMTQLCTHILSTLPPPPQALQNVCLGPGCRSAPSSAGISQGKDFQPTSPFPPTRQLSRGETHLPGRAWRFTKNSWGAAWAPPLTHPWGTIVPLPILWAQWSGHESHRFHFLWFGTYFWIMSKSDSDLLRKVWCDQERGYLLCWSRRTKPSLPLPRHQGHFWWPRLAASLP